MNREIQKLKWLVIAVAAIVILTNLYFLFLLTTKGTH